MRNNNLDHYKTRAQEKRENSKHIRLEQDDSVKRSVVILRWSALVGNSNKARKNYSKYYLPNPSTCQHIMNVKVEKKPRLATI